MVSTNWYSFLPVSPLTSGYSNQHRGMQRRLRGPGNTATKSQESTRRRRGASGEHGPGQEVGPDTRPRSLKRARPTRPSISPRQHITSMLVPHEVEIPQFSPYSRIMQLNNIPSVGVGHVPEVHIFINLLQALYSRFPTFTGSGLQSKGL